MLIINIRTTTNPVSRKGQPITYRITITKNTTCTITQGAFSCSTAEQVILSVAMRQQGSLFYSKLSHNTKCPVSGFIDPIRVFHFKLDTLNKHDTSNDVLIQK